MYQEDRYSLTPAGQDALEAAELKALCPTLYAAVEAMTRSGGSPAHVARHVRAAGASDNLTRRVESTVRALRAG